MADTRAGLAAPLAHSEVQVAVAIAAVLAGVAVLFGQTFASLVDVWTQSDTFAHCFLIAPISLYLIWRRREALGCAPKKPSVVGLGAVLALSVMWLVSTIAALQVGQQFAAVLLVPAAVLAVLGIETSKQIAFPLAFLVFAVPFGEALIPALMDFTASFTVASLRLTGIPVLREGFFFKIPSGDFEVAKACSGIRYLIACSTLGVLYSYLSFRSWRKRAIFIVASIVAPIVANGIRAYGIVMIAHLSDMRLAVGVDHFIYGWVFFAALVVSLFWIGGKFADPPDVRPAAATNAGSRQRASNAAIFGVAALTVVCAAAGPYVFLARLSVPVGEARVPALPGSLADWSGSRAPIAAWSRPLPDAAVAASALYMNDRGSVELTALTFQPGTIEVVGSMRRLVDDARWPILDVGKASVASRHFEPNELVLRANNGFIVVWYWYVIGTQSVARDWRAKVGEGWLAIRYGRADSTLVVLSSDAAEAQGARAVLKDFVESASQAIDSCATGAVAGCVSL